jgi:hypothetical protein
MSWHRAVFVALSLCVPFAPCLAAPVASPGSVRLDHAVQGLAGTVLSVAHARELAPERTDLAKHAAAGGAIATVVGSLADSRLGWRAGVAIGAGKEIFNDALLGRGCPQLDDFLVTAGAAVFAGTLPTRVAPLVLVDGRGLEVRLSWAF